MDTDSASGGSLKPQANVLTRSYRRFCQIYQKLLDTWTPHSVIRWVATLCLGFLYMLRVLYLQGWYIITYALGIYHLNLFIAFLSPKIDPAMEMEDYEEGPELPTKMNEEFRPFIRRLPEFKFWYSATKAIIIAMLCTCFEAFNIPVFWPILVMYFITLFCITMKRQIKDALLRSARAAFNIRPTEKICENFCLHELAFRLHMIKYRYIPFTHGKPRYRSVDDSGKAIPPK